ncbi:MAG: hypothetical protein HZC14_02235 [Candidatus Niyogibacteria bacterium]|nr:hypothetical protein [Candidatus Niyogibacteria bacterium]
MLNISYMSSILSHPTWDLIAIFLFIVAGFFYGWLSGKARLLSVLLSIYIAQILFVNMHFLNFFIAGRTLLETFLMRISVFSVLVIVLSHLFYKTFLRSISEEPRIWWKVFVLSFLEVGLLMASIFTLLPAVELFTFSPVVKYVFASPDAFLWWLVLPLAALFIIMRR